MISKKSANDSRRNDLHLPTMTYANLPCENVHLHVARLLTARLKWNTDKRISFERELQERLKAAKDTWTTTELPEILQEEQRKWQKDMLGDYTVRS